VLGGHAFEVMQADYFGKAILVARQA